MRVFLLDVLCTVPYYLGALCLALRRAGAETTLGCTNYYQDLDHFPSRGLRPDPGAVDLVARFASGNATVRRPLKLIEGCLNLAALGVRFLLHRPDVLHVQYLSLVPYGVPFDIWLVKWARFLGSRLVYTVHDRLPHDTGTRYHERFARLYRMFDGVVCHNEDTRKRLAEEFHVEASRIRVIPHGPLFADLQEVPPDQARARLGLPDDAAVVLWQGILKPYKGVDYLLDAWALVVRERPRAMLLVVGTGEAELLDGIRRHVEKLGLEANVKLDFRYVPEAHMAACYSASDVVVYPYREITTSGALMTGLAQRKALIATRLPAFLEVVEDGESARLVDYGDRAQLAQVIVELLGDPAQRERLASGAERVMNERFGWDAIAAQTLSLYRDLLAAR